MRRDEDYWISSAAGPLALAALISVSAVGAALAEDKSATASLFDPHLMMPGPISPTFTRPQDAPLPAPSTEPGPAETHSVAADRNDAKGPAQPDRRSADVRTARKLGSGRASWYQHPGRTANGETFRPDGLTAAHHTLPLGSRVRVVNQGNGRSVVVRITDRTNQRTQAKRSYVIDLSRGSARMLGITGVAQVALYESK